MFQLDELKDKFSAETKNKKIVIALNHFETITKRSVDLFYFFLNAPGVTLVCNYEDNFKEHAYGLFTKMEHFIEAAEAGAEVLLAASVFHFNMISIPVLDMAPIFTYGLFTPAEPASIIVCSRSSVSL